MCLPVYSQSTNPFNTPSAPPSADRDRSIPTHDDDDHTQPATGSCPHRVVPVSRWQTTDATEALRWAANGVDHRRAPIPIRIGSKTCSLSCDHFLQVTDRRNGSGSPSRSSHGEHRSQSAVSFTTYASNVRARALACIDAERTETLRSCVFLCRDVLLFVVIFQNQYNNCPNVLHFQLRQRIVRSTRLHFVHLNDPKHIVLLHTSSFGAGGCWFRLHRAHVLCARNHT